MNNRLSGLCHGHGYQAGSCEAADEFHFGGCLCPLSSCVLPALQDSRQQPTLYNLRSVFHNELVSILHCTKRSEARDSGSFPPREIKKWDPLASLVSMVYGQEVFCCPTPSLHWSSRLALTWGLFCSLLSLQISKLTYCKYWSSVHSRSRLDHPSPWKRLCPAGRGWASTLRLLLFHLLYQLLDYLWFLSLEPLVTMAGPLSISSGTVAWYRGHQESG